MCEICSKLTIKTLERRQWRRFGDFIVNFEHISHLALAFLLLTLNMQLPSGNVMLQNQMARVGLLEVEINYQVKKQLYSNNTLLLNF